ncbi:putative secreted protein (Por secretion system target) [Coprobacter fastidiosus NSB1 = JCM 33896]|uniref:Putative secreted protein (Por secretion system target) n=3 Tax=Coprobacter fastidiosus TaxID=1099853 RepID=A0A495W9B2_9BACT|nr:putative secreted protein (Por secretion system target) [Coprobacter fastidiosus NSB1 = JCM 33896]
MKYLIKMDKELFLLNKTISAQKHIIKMKNKIFSVLFILILSGNGYAQTPIRYEYDRIGNVILRYKISVQNLQRTIQEKTSGTNPEPIAGKAMKVYPNPTRGVVKIVFSGMGDAIDIQTRLYNSKGSLLKSEIGNSSAPISIDMSSYPPNWYILKVIAGKEAKEFKIIKE